MNNIETVVVETDLAGEVATALAGVVVEIHRQDHRIFVSLRFDGRDLAVCPDFIQAVEPEGVLAVSILGQKLPVERADVFDEEGLTVARLADQDVSHLGR